MSHLNPVIPALRGVVGGAAGGAAVATVGILSFRALQPLGAGDSVQLGYVGLWMLAGVAVAGFWSWQLAQGVAKGWLRGVTSALAVLGGLGLSGAAMPIDFMFPPSYLVVYVIVLVAIAVAIARNAKKTGEARPEAGPAA